MEDGPPQKTRWWHKWGSIAALATTAVVVIGAFSTLATATHNYFATNKRVQEIEFALRERQACVDDLTLEILDLRLQSINHYLVYVNGKTNTLAVETDHVFDGQEIDLEELRTGLEQAWTTAQLLNQQADKMTGNQKEICDEARRRNR